MFLLSSVSRSQNVAINTSGAVPSASAILDLSNTADLALLCPQVSLTNITTLAPVPAPGPAGLLVYNTNAATVGGSGTGYYFWDGAKWNYLTSGGAASAWNLLGNTGTNPGINYLGTSDAKDLIFKTNAVERMRILAAGGVGIGTPTPLSALDVSGGASAGTYAGVNAAPANGLIVSGQMGIGTNAPNASAALDITSTTTGFLPPRLTTAQITALAAPATGLIVVNITTGCLEYYSGIAWKNMACPCAGPPPMPGTITGSMAICTSSPGNVYSIAVVAGATSYLWTVPAGIGTITAGQGTTSITITAAATPATGNIIVTAINGCGAGPAQSIADTVYTIPATPGAITGSASIRAGIAGYIYSISSVPQATGYTWTVPGSVGTITSGQGTTSIMITSAATAGTGSISVVAHNLCGTSAASNLTVNVNVITHGTVTFPFLADSVLWTVPNCVTQLTISATGGSGGNASHAATTGGAGATIVGVCTVISGDNLYIVTGGQGVSAVNAGGGGGASYVWDAHTGNLIIAAAGGGGGGYSAAKNGANGGINVVTNAVVVGTGDGAGGTLGNGGNGGVNGGAGAGGAGWAGIGGLGGPVDVCTGGDDEASSFLGGTGFIGGNNGGYGGGGGGGNNGGGGGGGYNGGGGGNGNGANSGQGADGGGSYLNGVLSSTAQTNIGNGTVTITW